MLLPVTSLSLSPSLSASSFASRYSFLPIVNFRNLCFRSSLNMKELLSSVLDGYVLELLEDQDCSLLFLILIPSSKLIQSVFCFDNVTISSVYFSNGSRDCMIMLSSTVYAQRTMIHILYIGSTRNRIYSNDIPLF